MIIPPYLDGISLRIIEIYNFTDFPSFLDMQHYELPHHLAFQHHGLYYRGLVGIGHEGK